VPEVNLRTQFGADPSAPGTTNYAALANAIQYCKDHKTNLYVPAGGYTLDITGHESQAFTLADDLLVFGDGAGTTKFTMVTANANKSGIGFYCGIDAVLEFRDVAVEGLYATYPNVLTQTFVNFAHYGTARSGALLLTRATLTKGSHTVKSEAVTVELVDCTFGGRMGVLAAQNVDWGRVHATRCTFNMIDPQDGHYHAFYLADGCSFRAQNCTWVASDSGGLAVRQGGNSQGLATYWEVTDCTSALGIQTSGARASTLTRVDFAGAGADTYLLLSGNRLDAQSCTFNISANNFAAVDYGYTTEDTHFTDCTFQSSTGPAILFRQISSPGEWVCTRCTFAVLGANTTGNAILRPTIDSSGSGAQNILGRVRLVDCTLTSENQAELIYMHGGSGLTMTHCTTSSRRGIRIEANASLGFDLQLDINTLACTDANSIVGALQIVNEGVGAVRVAGSDNAFSGVKQIIITADAGPLPTGTLVPKVATGSVIASAATISLDPSVNAAHLTGVATINQIEVAGFVGDTQAKRLFYGPVTLTADAACSLGVSGNIRPTGGARTLAPGEQVSFGYLQSDGLWHEQELAVGTAIGTLGPLVEYDSGVPGRGGQVAKLPTPIATTTLPVAAFRVTDVMSPVGGSPNFSVSVAALEAGGQGFGWWVLRGDASHCDALVVGGPGVTRENNRAVTNASAAFAAALGSYLNPNQYDVALGWLIGRGLLPGL
jgi:hypothetical protein